MRKIIYIFLSAMVLFSCNPARETTDKKLITVSILPQKYFVGRLAGDKFRVFVLVPPGASHETYEPSPKDLRDISQSALFFRTGYLSLENQVLEKIKEYKSGVKFVNTAAGASLINGIPEDSESHGHVRGIDPHMWLSPLEVRKQISIILQAIIMEDPENQTFYIDNYKKFTDDLDKLDLYIRNSFKNIKRRKFIIFHPALSYYARDYGLEQVALEFEGKSPSVEHMKEITDLARKEGIKTIFMQSQFDQHNTEAFAREIGGRIVELDPVPADWLKKMYQMTDKLKQALTE